MSFTKELAFKISKFEITGGNYMAFWRKQKEKEKEKSSQVGTQISQTAGVLEDGYRELVKAIGKVKGDGSN